eukprot:m.52645 g.52645  ORF g.52645 m.52645 type:complete len:63 (+) comp11322_c0_seq3:3872-4060(+)
MCLCVCSVCLLDEDASPRFRFGFHVMAHVCLETVTSRFALQTVDKLCDTRHLCHNFIWQLSC